MKPSPVQFASLYPTLKNMDFGWMSKDQMRLVLSLMNIEDGEFYREEEWTWCIDTSFTRLVLLFHKSLPPAFSRRKDVCKTKWKRWVLCFLDS